MEAVIIKLKEEHNGVVMRMKQEVEEGNKGRKRKGELEEEVDRLKGVNRELTEELRAKEIEFDRKKSEFK